jgi:hypothetical protein
MVANFDSLASWRERRGKAKEKNKMVRKSETKDLRAFNKQTGVEILNKYKRKDEVVKGCIIYQGEICNMSALRRHAGSATFFPTFRRKRELEENPF